MIFALHCLSHLTPTHSITSVCFLLRLYILILPQKENTLRLLRAVRKGSVFVQSEAAQEERKRVSSHIKER